MQIQLNQLRSILTTQPKLVFDTGIFLAYFGKENAQLNEILKEHVMIQTSSLEVWLHSLTLTELYYIQCRKLGISHANELKHDMEENFRLFPVQSIIDKAGQLKCKYSIALSDCFSIALAIHFGMPVIFLKEEELIPEIIEEIERTFNIQIYILSFD